MGDHETDVIVVGLGAAGCAAAIAAHDAGARVLVLEKMPVGHEGGNTRVSGGTWFDNKDPAGAATYLQSLSAGFPVPEEIVKVWAEETARNTGWIESLGLKAAAHGNYSPDYAEMPGSDAYGGFMAVDGVLGEGRLFEGLHKAVRERAIDVRVATPARRLIQSEPGGAIRGVLAEAEGGEWLHISARRGVVLATGGFDANPQMVRDYLRIPGEPVSWGSPAATGDGIAMAQKVGAGLWHMDNMVAVCGLRAPGFDRGFFVAFLFATGFIFVGMDGSRLTNELPQIGHGHARLHGSYELFPQRPIFVVFDEATRRAGPISPARQMLPIGWNVIVEGYEWSADNSREIEAGWIHRAETLAELAKLIGTDAATLEQSVRTYNESCSAGTDIQFGRDPHTLTPLATPPFYAFKSEPMLGWTNGGPKRNHRAQVLDPFDQVIPRLYAAGDVSSTYSWCKAGGMHIADALAFGRIAGREAAANAENAWRPLQT